MEVRDGGGEVAGGFRSPVMWDSDSVVPGEVGVVEPVEFEVASGLAGQDAGGGAPVEVEVVADGAWLIDPDRVFPVVIDPTYQLVSGGAVFDAFVQQGVTADQSGSVELKLGNNGSGQVARSYMNFDANLFKGRQVVQSTLSLYESWSYNCSARPFSVWGADLASGATRWTSQPVIGSKDATLSVAAGYSSACPGARVQLDTTSFAPAASATSASQVGRASVEAYQPPSWRPAGPRFYHRSYSKAAKRHPGRFVARAATSSYSAYSGIGRLRSR